MADVMDMNTVVFYASAIVFAFAVSLNVTSSDEIRRRINITQLDKKTFSWMVDEYAFNSAVPYSVRRKYLFSKFLIAFVLVSNLCRFIYMDQTSGIIVFAIASMVTLHSAMKAYTRFRDSVRKYGMK